MSQHVITIIRFFGKQVRDLNLRYKRNFPESEEEFNQIRFRAGYLLMDLLNRIIPDIWRNVPNEKLTSNAFCFASIQLQEIIIKLIHLLIKTRRNIQQITLLKIWIKDLLKANLISIPDNYTTLHSCVSMGSSYFNVMALILDCGNQIHARDISGRTPLHVALDIESSSDVVNFLIRRGAHLDIPDFSGRLPITQILNRRDATTIDTSSLINLKCLSARVICESNITYKNEIVKTLEPFVDIHKRK